MGRPPPIFESARFGRAGPLPHGPHALYARDHGCALARASGPARRLHEVRASGRDHRGLELDRLCHPSRARADARRPADGGVGEAFLAPAHRSADCRKPQLTRARQAAALARRGQHGAVERVPGGAFGHYGSKQRSGLRSMPARYLFLDEVDAYPASADEEGDPVALAEARTRTFSWRSKIFLTSTPTIHGVSRIEREFEASDQRRFFVPCPHCGAIQWLKFERLRWDKGKPESAHYLCESCEGRIEERHKTAMLSAGEWRPAKTSADASTIGFHLSALYSPIGWLSWVEIARLWEAAQTTD